jgi:hypothetical protein
MGYDIYIGNGEMEPVEQYDDEEVYKTPYARVINGKTIYYRVVVKDTTQPEAPTFPNEWHAHTNNCHPSYCGWSDFCRRAGLIDLFFDDKQGLMRKHPGFQTLHIDHAATIQNALNEWKARHPDSVPGFEEFTLGSDAPTVGYDWVLARLEWLNWWVQWSLKHCENAGIFNF